MVDQIFDKHTSGMPDDLVLNRAQTEAFRDEAERIRDETNDIRDAATAKTSADVLEATALVKEAQQAAKEATSWVNAGAGVSIGAEEPAVKRNGHVWLVESSKARNPLWPGDETFAALDTWPEREGSEATGSHVITAIRRWDAGETGEWTDFTLANSLINA